MGIDIHGWLEIRENKIDDNSAMCSWLPILKIDQLAERDHDLFGCLFGVGPFRSSDEPIAAFRGIPDDASDIVREELSKEYFHSSTWINVDEIDLEYKLNGQEMWISVYKCEISKPIAKIKIDDIRQRRLYKPIIYDLKELDIFSEKISSGVFDKAIEMEKKNEMIEIKIDSYIFRKDSRTLKDIFNKTGYGWVLIFQIIKQLNRYAGTDIPKKELRFVVAFS